MVKFAWTACVVGLLLGFGSASSGQQPPDSAPDQAFKTVHLMAVDSTQEPALRAAINDLNGEFKRQGCAACAYHLLRMFAGSQSPYNFMVTSDWPSRSEYLRIHDSAETASAYARNPVFATLEAKQFYGRFVEVQ